MKNHFSITVSDVHGSRTYSFNQFVKKFVRYLLLLVFIILLVGGTTIWWLNDKAAAVEAKHHQAVLDHQKRVSEQQAAFHLLEDSRKRLQQQLDEKTQSLEVLNDTLESLEDMLGENPDVGLPLEDRAKIAQLSTLEKKIAFELIPSGRPVKEFKGVTSGFGWRIHPVDGKRKFHHAIDYRGKKGDLVIAPADGVVEYAAYNKKSGYGKMIIIAHANGFKTLYGHLNKLLVKSGQMVTKGTDIGHIGNTGRSSGPHLHYEVRFLHRKINPAPFVNWNLKNYDEIFTQVKEVPWGSLTQTIKNRVQRVQEQLSLKVARSPER